MYQWNEQIVLGKCEMLDKEHTGEAPPTNEATLSDWVER